MLNESFVPVAIDINLVKRQSDSEGDFFRHIAEQGHYAGRTKPTPTRQGLYISGVDGDLLDSLNSTRAESITGLIKRGLAEWDRKQKAEKTVQPLRESNEVDANFVVEFPEGGLILRQTMRDLPISSMPRRRTKRHNFDHAWLTANEKSQFVPKEMKPGSSWEIPSSTVKRFVSFHTVDQVNGEADAWDRDHVKEASINARVTKVLGTKVTIELSGHAKCSKDPSGATNPYNQSRVEKHIANDLSIQGHLVYDSELKSFESFRVLAAGVRSGADVYNSRTRDMGPSPIAFAFEMLEDKPENRIKPKFLLWKYFREYP